ncbi:FAD-binding domain-containing protein [Cyathus striatus]|nr:FAD-binding domain-containing protein [Cyathus striatus]
MKQTIYLVVAVAICSSFAELSAPWLELNRTLDGRLEEGIPFSRPCFQRVSGAVAGQFDSSKCDIIRANYFNHDTRASTLGAYINVQWETCQVTSANCLIDPSTGLSSSNSTCSQGSVMLFGIAIKSASDVITAFEFSTKYSIPLVIKNTGHDYKGRSSGPDSLALWMHQLQSISMESNFIPNGCPVNMPVVPAVTYEAGVTFDSLIDFADDHNITIPTGGDTTVGAAGGYIQGGGHSVLSNTLGLAVDRALQFEVVTPNGNHIFANECQNQDMFFALRGGGGGTFGVVLSVTTKALPQHSISVMQLGINSSISATQKLVAFMAENALEMANAGWGGYIVPNAGFVMANPITIAKQSDPIPKKIEEFATQVLSGNFTFAIEPSYKSFFTKFVQSVPVGVPLTTTSRLIPVDHFTAEATRDRLVDMIITALQNATLPVLFAHTPFHFGDQGGTSVTPAWRNSLWHIAFGDTWDISSVATTRQTYSKLNTLMDGFRKFVPNSGAYVNEADVYETDFQDTFWGENYDRLLQIKNKYDPNHLLDCWQCVGWKGALDSKYRCYVSI